MRKISSMFTDADSLLDSTVEDSGGGPIGVLVGVWVDQSQIRYLEIGADTQSKQVQIVPVGKSRFDEYVRLVRLSYPFNQIQSGPAFQPSSELNDQQERSIRQHFGEKAANSPTDKNERSPLKNPVSEAEAAVGAHPSNPPGQSQRTLQKITSQSLKDQENLPTSEGEDLQGEVDTWEDRGPYRRLFQDRQRRSPTEL
jgi:hypothetical protein